MSEQGADKAGFIDFYTQILAAQFERLNFAQFLSYYFFGNLNLRKSNKAHWPEKSGLPKNLGYPNLVDLSEFFDQYARAREEIPI